MSNYERIAETPEALGAFLAALPIASGPWDVKFHKTFCNACTAANCDGENCPHSAERNNPLWWLNQEEEDGKQGQHITFQNGRMKLGPGASFRLEDTHIHGQYPAPEGVKVEAVERLQNLCSFCKEMERYRDGDSGDVGRQYGLIRGRAWGIDVVMLEFAIYVLSELQEIREVRIPAKTDAPGAWELMRDILAGTRPAPEGTVFDVVIDLTGNPMAIRRREEPGATDTARTLTLTMPGGEPVKLNSAAEAYGLAASIEKMAARVWPKDAPEK